MAIQHLNRQMRGGGGNMYRMTALLFCLLAFAFALPAQGQTAIPLTSCGLPQQSVVLTAQTTPKTFNLTENCTPQTTSGIWMHIQSGEFTINGNGYKIQGGNTITNIIRVNGASAVLNLNDVIIFGNGTWTSERDGIDVRAGTFNANNVTFNGNVYRTVLTVSGTGTRVNLTNVQFTRNRAPVRHTARGGALNIWGLGIVVTINGGAFINNSGQPFVIRVNIATLRLRGAIRFQDNLDNINPTTYEPAGDPAIPISLRDDGLASLDDSGARYLGVLAPRRKRKDPTPMPTSTATPRPQIAATHIALQTSTGMTFRPAFGLDSGVYFRQLDGAGIGVQSLIDAGFIDAVDVYGYAEQGVEVCFPHVGRVIFLDANTSPRAMAPLASTVVNGQTCVSIDSPGSLVLLPAG